MRCLISGTAAAASATLTVTRTISDPASASSMHCCAVDAASAVSVIVIDWTTTGAPPPTWTRPTLTPTVLWSFTNGMEDPMVASRTICSVRLQPDVATVRLNADATCDHGDVDASDRRSRIRQARGDEARTERAGAGRRSG